MPPEGQHIAWLQLCRASDRGYAYLSARVGDGPGNTLPCYFPENNPALSYQDSYRWRHVCNIRLGIGQ
ncbi:MAG TPA: hypothetical protein QGH10_00340 [Armatimonadota bacterium]|nr:hypothetical protein [Armatimonadota bacterium]